MKEGPRRTDAAAVPWRVDECVVKIKGRVSMTGRDAAADCATKAGRQGGRGDRQKAVAVGAGVRAVRQAPGCPADAMVTHLSATRYALDVCNDDLGGGGRRGKFRESNVVVTFWGARRFAREVKRSIASFRFNNLNCNDKPMF